MTKKTKDDKPAYSVQVTAEGMAKAQAPMDQLTLKSFTPKVWKRETKELMCNLTDEEFKLRSSALALCIREIANLEYRVKMLKDEIKGKEELQSRLVDAVQYRQEKRDVPLELIPDFEHGTVSSYRLDTLEFHERRMMCESERQQELPLNDKMNEPGEVVATEADK